MTPAQRPRQAWNWHSSMKCRTKSSKLTMKSHRSNDANRSRTITRQHQNQRLAKSRLRVICFRKCANKDFLTSSDNSSIRSQNSCKRPSICRAERCISCWHARRTFASAIKMDANTFSKVCRISEVRLRLKWWLTKSSANQCQRIPYRSGSRLYRSHRGNFFWTFNEQPK